MVNWNDIVGWAMGCISLSTTIIVCWAKWLKKKYDTKDLSRLQKENEQLRNILQDISRRM